MADDREKAVARARAAVLVVTLVALAVAAWAFGWGDYLFGEDGMARLEALVDENFGRAALLYIVLVVVGGVALAIPGFVFSIAAGVLFGPLWGTLLCTIAGTLAAVVAFVAGRTFLKDYIKPIVMRNRYVRKWLFENADRDALIVLLVTRMVPIIPYNVQNFAYGVTDIELSTYTWGTFLFMIPGTAAYTFAAAGVVNEEQRLLYLVIAVVLTVAVVVVGYALYRRYIKD